MARDPELRDVRSKRDPRRSQTAAEFYASLTPLSAEPQSIRVLDLYNASSGTEDAPLTGTLRVISLFASPQFTALSYVWSPPSPTNIIMCGTCTLNITTNYHNALTQLRKRYGALTVWIDALCINQEDVDEKVSQIALMADIYSWAYLQILPHLYYSDVTQSMLYQCSEQQIFTGKDLRF